MKKEIYLERFGEEVNHYQVLLQYAIGAANHERVYNYPVFIFHQHEVNVGLPIVDREQVAGGWSVNISTLEEFYIKGLVMIEQVEEIKAKIIGQPPQYCCLVLAEGKGSLIFLPRVMVNE